MNRLLNAMGMIMSRDIKARIRQGKVKPPSRGRGATLVRSGKLVNSIRHVVVGEQVTVGSDLVYARIHHDGGIIKPVNAKYLAIPLTKEAAVKRPREWADTFIRKGVIFRNTADGIEALYALKAQVTIPSRPYMFMSDETRNSLRQLALEYIQANVKGRK
jgi:phage gpG-like protein